ENYLKILNERISNNTIEYEPSPRVLPNSKSFTPFFLAEGMSFQSLLTIITIAFQRKCWGLQLDSLEAITQDRSEKKGVFFFGEN
ncbi:9157_t:CDS:2, partial [Rhizophagus irregularis]